MEDTYTREQVTAAVQRAVDLMKAAEVEAADSETMTVLDLMTTAVDRLLADPTASFSEIVVAGLAARGFNATLLAEDDGRG